MLQTRSAKRPAQAAVRFAVDAVARGPARARGRDRDDRPLGARRAAAPDIRPGRRLHGGGRAASPPRPARPRARSSLSAGRRCGAAGEGRDVILVRSFTEADDVAGFHAARGILTSEGGKASHAALVARGMGRPAVTGAARWSWSTSPRARCASASACCAPASGSRSTAATARITLDDVPLVEPEVSAQLQTVLAWCDELRTLGVRANADTPHRRAQGDRAGRRRASACAAPSTCSSASASR